MGLLWGIVCLRFFFLRASEYVADWECAVWYFFNDVYPPLHNGSRPLDPPRWWMRIFEGRPVDSDEAPIHNDIAAAAAPEVR